MYTEKYIQEKIETYHIAIEALRVSAVSHELKTSKDLQYRLKTQLADKLQRELDKWLIKAQKNVKETVTTTTSKEIINE